MRTLLLILCMLASSITWCQSNIFIATDNDYQLDVQLGNYSYGRDHAWQVKFYNIPAGKYSITVTVRSRDSSYVRTQTFNLAVGEAEEAVWYVTPYTNGLELNAAYVSKKAGSAGTNAATGGDGRPLIHEGKPVFSKADIDDLLKSTARQFSDDDKTRFLKANTHAAWLYTEDVILILKKLFEARHKVDFAIFAYANVIDKHRYYKLSDSFFFASDYQQVADHVAKQK